MYPLPALARVLPLAALFAVAAASIFSSDEPNVQVTAAFPDDNPFGLITNGQKNTLTLTVENHSSNNISLLSAAGSFHDPTTEQLVRNTSSASYAGVVIPSTAKLSMPYTFHTELKPKDMKLNLWIDYLESDKKWRAYGFDGIVTVVEQPVSIFDPLLWATYALVLGMIGASGYFAYQSFMPQKKRTRRPIAVSEPVGSVTASNASGTYQEEWIPAHHIKKKKADGAVSGPESGAESEGAKPKRRSTRKKA